MFAMKRYHEHQLLLRSTTFPRLPNGANGQLRLVTDARLIGTFGIVFDLHAEKTGWKGVPHCHKT